MYPLFRNLLFRLEPERAHAVALGLLNFARALPVSRLLHSPPPSLPRRVMGIEFPNPVGLAAGLDKDGDYLPGLASLGFGFIEIGTVTPRPQPGNPRPRLFRLTDRRALINRLGFNNKGVEHLVEQIRRANYRGVLGINIGKNFDTPVERATDDYVQCLRRVYPLADYVVVNISSPNTPGLRNLQHGDMLDDLLGTLKREQQALAEQHAKRVPLVVKIAPDMDGEQLRQLAKKLLDYGVDGVTATNTTLGREGVQGTRHADEAGGLSGAPLTERSTQVLHELAELLQGRIPIIGVGGIMDGADAVAKMQAGASLVQIYSGFIYRGPELITEAVQALATAERKGPAA